MRTINETTRHTSQKMEDDFDLERKCIRHKLCEQKRRKTMVDAESKPNTLIPCIMPHSLFNDRPF
jgi:hypothetical protein